MIPIKLNESIDILNTSSEYYKDICYLSTSESGTDMIIKDRKKEYVEKNKTVCQEYCNFSDYNYDEKKAICSCLIKESPSSFADMNIDISKLYENFENINNKNGISNLGLISCNVLSSTENIESNTGFYLLLFILVFFVIIFIIFYSKGYNMIEDTIDDAIFKNFKDKKNQESKKIKKFRVYNPEGK